MGLALAGDGKFDRNQISRVARRIQRIWTLPDTILVLVWIGKGRGELRECALRVMPYAGSTALRSVSAHLMKFDERISILQSCSLSLAKYLLC